TCIVNVTYIGEEGSAVGGGVEPAAVSHAALMAGDATGGLHLRVEQRLTLSQEIRPETKTATEPAGAAWVAQPSAAVIDWRVEAGRTGRKDKAGFYDYDEDGKRTALWSGVREQYDSGSTDQPFADLQERMLFAEAIETIKCLDEGVLTSVPDANI